MQRISLREFLHRVLRHLLVFSSKEVVNKAADGNVQDSARKRFQQLACKANGGSGRALLDITSGAPTRSQLWTLLMAPNMHVTCFAILIWPLCLKAT